jgi:hypothetical protein
MKSFVSVEQAVCPVCGRVHDTGALLLSKTLRPVFEHTTITRYELCPEHKAKADEGYVALVECSNEPTSIEDAFRTGAIAFIRREAWDKCFNTPAPPGPMGFCMIGVITQLQEKVNAP